METIIEKRNRHDLFFFTGLLLITLFILSSCGVSGRYGGLRLSSEVNDLFESFTVLPDYQYYYSGSDAEPNAIMGIHKDFTLRSDLWKPVGLTRDGLKSWINRMTGYRGYAIRTYGSNIVGPNGEQIGIWYSPWDQTTVKLLDNQQVVIHTPDTKINYPRPGVIFGFNKED